MSDEDMLKHVAHVAAHRYGLVVWQWLPGPVGTHAADSLHYQRYPDGVGKAFDCYGARWRVWLFLRWLWRSGHWRRLTEGIYNGRVHKLSVKDGRKVPHSLWGAATWAEHRDHVHVAIA